jgi:glc operon protein GlcG
MRRHAPTHAGLRSLPFAVVLVAALAAGRSTAEDTGIVYVPAERVRAAFAKGEPLREQGDLKVHASRREGPGQAEIHARDTDVIHVLEGHATIVTGGRVVEPRTVAPDEVRGAGIEGGDSRALAPGDVLVVPRGVPHWFRSVPGPFTYYVVKVTGEAAR